MMKDKNSFFGALIKGSPPVLNGYGNYTKAIDLMGEQRQLLIADNWAELERLGYEGLGYAHASSVELSSKMGIAYYHQLNANLAFANTLEDHAKDEEDRAQYFGNMIADIQNAMLEIEDAEILANLQQKITSLEALKEGNIKNNALLEYLRSTTYELNAMDQTAIEAVAALSMRSLSAICHYNFEQQSAIVENQNLVSLEKTPFGDELAAELETYKQELQNQLKEIYLAVVGEKNISLAIQQLIAYLEGKLPQVARTLATVAAFATQLKNSGKGGASEKIGKIGAQGGDAYREGLAAMAAAYYLALENQAVEPAPSVLHLLKNSHLMAFDVLLPNGKDTEISKVNTLDDNDFVEVAGFVTDIQTGRDNDDKLITQIELHDPSSNSTVTAAGVFVHFRHLGLLEGSYCNLSGFWQSTSSINKGNAAIEIDKLSVKELAKSSWKIAFLDLSSKFYARWPGNYNIQYNLAKHISAIPDGESESDILGAGELIFKPFIK